MTDQPLFAHRHSHSAASPGAESTVSPARIVARDVRRNLPTWEELVPAGTPVELEVGSGKGLFLQQAAGANPHHFYLGLELAAKFANRAAQRLHRHGLSNALVLCADARVFLNQVVPSASVHAVHVYFPDPWWRNKHKKRRVLNEESIQHIWRVLLPGGNFHFWTDVLDYYEHVCQMVIDQTAFAGPHFVPQRHALHSMDYTTHFERRARQQNQPVYRALFVKPAGEETTDGA
ncbi:MAG: hypothetical protein KatS3mg111_1127 [Pirellulaceae bacterium]|nr:MAG: hypothetical protein KatS3mg111_1127 [Pirellulaceae bacterium]